MDCPCAKFGYWTNRQNDRIIDAANRFTPATTTGVSKYGVGNVPVETTDSCQLTCPKTNSSRPQVNSRTP